MNKIISIGLIGALFTAAMLAVFVLPAQEIIVENPEIQTASLAILDTKSENSEITIFAVGDIMLDRGVEYMIRNKGENDFRFPFLKIADELKSADIVFGNLETVISDKGIKVGSIYSFRAELEAIQGLKFAGFNILSLANNHMLDYTREALEDTMERLKDAKIDYVGAGFNEEEAFSLKIKEIGDTKIGFLAYTNLGPESWEATEENSGVAWVNEKSIENIKKDIEKAKQKTDVLIVSMHSGEEYSTTITAFQEKFAKSCIDAGADLIIGHHPHIVQKIEKYKGKDIVYSLGNFIFDQGFSEDTMEGMLLDIRIKDKKIDKVIPQKIKISNLFQPYFSLE